MIAAWMVYAAAIGVACGVAALALERAARAIGRPVRWIWVVATVVAVASPVAMALRPAETPIGVVEIGAIAQPPIEIGAPTAITIVSATVVGERPVSAMERARILIEQARLLIEQTRLRVRSIVAGGRLAPLGPLALRRVDSALIALWGVASLALLLRLALAFARLRRAPGAWESQQVDGVDVLVSPDTGPAVLGLRSPRIVVPRWVLELDQRARAAVLIHEEEHRRARDPRLLLLSIVATALVPWNPAVWWLARRLRFAVETDCDARVLATTQDSSAYTSLLLATAERRIARAGMLAPAFTLSMHTLERRISIMTSPRPRRPLATATALAAIAAATVSVASLVPVPPAFAFEAPMSSSPVDAAVTSPASEASVPAPVVAQLPDTARRLAQPPRGDTALRPQLTPQQIREAIAIGRQIIPRGRDTTDSAQVADYVFRAGNVIRTPEGVYLFNQEKVYAENEVDVKAAPALPLPPIAYPSNLHAARVEGTVVVQFVVGPDGLVRFETFKEIASSHPLFTDAVRRHLRELRFTPALRARVAVPQLVQMPMEFVIRAPGDTTSTTAVTVVAGGGAQQPDTAALRRRLTALQTQMDAIQQEINALRQQLARGGRGGSAMLPVPAAMRDSQRVAARAAMGIARVFQENEVDVQVKLAPGNRAPDYPGELRAANIEGVVHATFVVGTDGRAIPSTIHFLRSDHPFFADAVFNHLPSMRFVPAVANGGAVAQFVSQPFVFSLGR